MKQHVSVQDMDEVLRWVRRAVTLLENGWRRAELGATEDAARYLRHAASALTDAIETADQKLEAGKTE